MTERAFSLLSHEQDFSQIQNLRWNTANNINFHDRTSSGKIDQKMTEDFFILKNLFLTYFWHMSPIFGAKKIFPKKFLTWVSSTVPKFRKS